MSIETPHSSNSGVGRVVVSTSGELGAVGARLATMRTAPAGSGGARSDAGTSGDELANPGSTPCLRALGMLRKLPGVRGATSAGSAATRRSSSLTIDGGRVSMTNSDSCFGRAAGVIMRGGVSTGVLNLEVLYWLGGRDSAAAGDGESALGPSRSRSRSSRGSSTAVGAREPTAPGVCRRLPCKDDILEAEGEKATFIPSTLWTTSIVGAGAGAGSTELMASESLDCRLRAAGVPGAGVITSAPTTASSGGSGISRVVFLLFVFFIGGSDDDAESALPPTALETARAL
jgi:hypothetical protein